MKKLFLVLFVLLMNVSAVFSESEKPVIAVMDFYSEDISKDQITSVTSSLSSELLKTAQFTVIEISRRDSLLEEMKFSLSGLADEENAIEIGALLSARALVLGSIAEAENSYLLSVKLVETETGEILRSAEGKYSSFNSLISSLPRTARELAGTEAIHKNKTAAFTLMGGGAVLTGAGTFFLVNGLLKLTAVDTAWNNYASMTTGDITAAYDEYLAAFGEAEDSKANLQFIGGISGAAVGLGLIGVSTWMLLSPPEIENIWSENSSLSMMFFPGADSLTIAFRLNPRIIM